MQHVHTPSSPPPFAEHITFIYASDIAAGHRFYHEVLRLELALDQGACRIYRITDSSYVGICNHREPSPAGVIVTLVTEAVDEWHTRLVTEGVIIDAPPSYSERFDVYQFFARDPDGYLIEIQSFGRPAAGPGTLGARS